MSILKISNNNFESEVINSHKPVLLDFWATWCGPCNMLSPVIEEIASENQDIKVGKINIDEESDLARSFGIMSIPTLVLVKDGKVVNSSVGFQSKQQIMKMMNS